MLIIWMEIIWNYLNRWVWCDLFEIIWRRYLLLADSLTYCIVKSGSEWRLSSLRFVLLDNDFLFCLRGTKQSFWANLWCDVLHTLFSNNKGHISKDCCSHPIMRLLIIPSFFICYFRTIIGENLGYHTLFLFKFLDDIGLFNYFLRKRET